MTTVSPLGTLYIAVAVERWNKSQDLEKKNAIRRLIQSENALQVHAGFDRLHEIIDAQAGEKFDGWKNIKRTLQNTMTAEEDLYSGARAELAFYLDCAFKAGHFEKLPMPRIHYT